MSELLQKLLSDSDIQVNENQLKQLLEYKKLVMEWNKKFNITAITDSDEFDLKHLYDSILILKSNVISNGHRVIDIGTGGGFPGIPLKIMLPKSRIVLMDSLKKRIGFLQHVIEQLGLSDTTAVHARAEELGRAIGERQSYDIAVSRAVAPLNTLSEYCMPFVKTGGYFISMKGSEGLKELNTAREAIKVLGGRAEKPIEYELSEGEHRRFLIVVKKIDNTPARYPRAGGKPKSSPL